MHISNKQTFAATVSDNFVLTGGPALPPNLPTISGAPASIKLAVGASKTVKFSAQLSAQALGAISTSDITVKPANNDADVGVTQPQCTGSGGKKVTCQTTVSLKSKDNTPHAVVITATNTKLPGFARKVTIGIDAPTKVLPLSLTPPHFVSLPAPERVLGAKADIWVHYDEEGDCNKAGITCSVVGLPNATLRYDTANSRIMILRAPLKRFILQIRVRNKTGQTVDSTPITID